MNDTRSTDPMVLALEDAETALVGTPTEDAIEVAREAIASALSLHWEARATLATTRRLLAEKEALLEASRRRVAAVTIGGAS